jgi:hypothetical protein
MTPSFPKGRDGGRRIGATAGRRAAMMAGMSARPRRMMRPFPGPVGVR